MSVLVSCICVTEGPWERAVHNFWQQNMPEEAIELLIVEQCNEDEVCCSFPEQGVGDSRVCLLRPGWDPLEWAQGRYLMNWSPVAAHGDTRVRDQLEHLQREGASKCLLSGVGMFCPYTYRAYLGRGAYPQTAIWDRSTEVDSTVVLEKPELFVTLFRPPGFPEDDVEKQELAAWKAREFCLRLQAGRERFDRTSPSGSEALVSPVVG